MGPKPYTCHWCGKHSHEVYYFTELVESGWQMVPMGRATLQPRCPECKP